MDCIVHCDGTNSCRNADIVCPIQGSCRVSSTGQTALYSATVDARAMVSGQLDIFASGWNSLSHAEIYCPQPSGDAQCLINVDGNDPDVLIGTRIHAVHGFNEIQINCDVKCIETNSCTNPVITAPINGSLQVTCSEWYSCTSAKIKGSIKSTNITVDCSMPLACRHANIMCLIDTAVWC
eukprot:501488_1